MKYTLYIYINKASYNKIENGNGECAKETTARPESRQQQKVTSRSLSHYLENLNTVIYLIELISDIQRRS